MCGATSATNKLVKSGTKTKGTINEFTLLIASWVIRARWREIQRFVRKLIQNDEKYSPHALLFFFFQNKRYALKGAAEET